MIHERKDNKCITTAEKSHRMDTMGLQRAEYTGYRLGTLRPAHLSTQEGLQGNNVWYHCAAKPKCLSKQATM